MIWAVPLNIATRPGLKARLQAKARSTDQRGAASTMLTSEAVGTTRVSRNPALSSNAAYSASVRYSPPGMVNMAMSSILPGCGVSPGGSTISTSSSRPLELIARRQWPRMVKHCS